DSVKAYESALAERLAELQAEIPENPASHRSLIQRALERRKPFGQKDGGYRDALIWQCILHDIAGRDRLTVFVTQNTNDFAAKDGTQFHRHLLDDLENHNLKGQVEICRSLDELIDKHVPTEDSIEPCDPAVASKNNTLNLVFEVWKSDWPEFIRRLSEFGVPDDKQISSELGAGVSGARIDDGFVQFQGMPLLEMEPQPRIQKLDEENVLVHWDVWSHDVEIEFELDRNQGRKINYRCVKIEEPDWTEDSMHAFAELDLELTLVYYVDAKTKSVKSWDIANASFHIPAWCKDDRDASGG
ncbi:MAG: PIN domain-containing protein, partial [Planctomycetaceae bacterium]